MIQSNREAQKLCKFWCNSVTVTQRSIQIFQIWCNMWYSNTKRLTKLPKSGVTVLQSQQRRHKFSKIWCNMWYSLTKRDTNFEKRFSCFQIWCNRWYSHTEKHKNFARSGVTVLQSNRKAYKIFKIWCNICYTPQRGRQITKVWNNSVTVRKKKTQIFQNLVIQCHRKPHEIVKNLL